VGQGDGQRHQLRGLVAGVAEHHALIAGAVLELRILAVFVFQGLVHAQGDVAGLLVDGLVMTPQVSQSKPYLARS
jgi:hypothetical protein